MDSNPYAVSEAGPAESEFMPAQFCIVGIRKFVILFLATHGLYTLYWFYSNWNAVRKSTGERVWPAGRAILSIFFVHALFRKMQQKIEESGKEIAFPLASLATRFVVLSILTNVLNRLSVNEVLSPLSDILSSAMLLPLCLTLQTAQKAVNHAEDDVHGAANDSLSLVNYLWIVIGLIFWGAKILIILSYLSGDVTALP